MTASAKTPPTATRWSVGQVVRAHAGYVGRTLRYLGVAEADLDDACQEVFLVVHRRLSEFEGRASITTWLYAICLRVASAHRRRTAQRRESTMHEPPDRPTGPTQEHVIRRQDARSQLQKLLADLDEDQRVVFVLFEIEERSMTEIAELAGCPLQTAYYRLHAARKQLEKGLRRSGVAPSDVVVPS